MVFIVDSKRFPAHRVVAAADSPVLAAMLTNGMRETIAKEIPVKSTDKATWELALRFMYTGCVELKNREIALNILHLAHHYEMTDLLEVAETYFCKYVLKDSVFSLYRLAEEYGLNKLKSTCERKLGKELIMHSREKDFKLLTFDAIENLLEQETVMVVSELDIFHAIRLWADIPSIDDDEDSGSAAEVKYEEAKKLLRNVNAEKMEPWEIEIACKYPFVRYFPGLVDAFIKRILAVSGIGKVNFGGKYPHRGKFTILFNIAEDETPCGTWKSKGVMYSPWKIDERTGRNWSLGIHLHGIEGSKKNVSAYLDMGSNSPPCTENQEFQIFVLKKGNKIPCVRTATRMFNENNLGCAIPDLIKKELVYGEGSEYISEEPKSLTCGVNIFRC